MTKSLLLIGLVALVGCTSDAGDTGDTGLVDTDVEDTDTDVPVAWDLLPPPGTMEDCALEHCIVTMTTSREAGDLFFWVADTDSESTPFLEEHTAFVLLDELDEDGNNVYQLDLDWVTSFDQQVDNESTLLNPEVLGKNWASKLTWAFEANSADGTETDCWTSGHDTSYFSEYCATVK